MTVVVESDRAQGFDIALRHLGRRQGQFAGVVEDRSIHWIERRAPIVRLDRLYQRVGLLEIANLFTEVQGMRLGSVETVVGARHRGGDHLALRPRQTAIAAVHDLEIELGRGLQNSRARALDSDDIVDFARTADRRPVELT